MNKPNRSRWGSSLRTLVWELDDRPLTLGEQLISCTIHEWYDAKHPVASIDEINFINSIDVDYCHHCGSISFVRNGYYRNGTRCFLCKDCNRKFGALTNTIFDNRKIPISERFEFLIHLFEFHSIRTSARDNRNAQTTGKYWLTEVFSVLENVQENVVLEGNVYIDEMFFPVIKNKMILKNGKKLRGISRNRICVAAGFDDHGHILLINEKTSKPSNKSTLEAYGNHIKPGAHLIHDSEHSHHELIKKLNLTDEVHPSTKTKGLPDKENPLDPINNLHDLSKRYMRAHGGYDRDNLQDWMNLIWFSLQGSDNVYEKIRDFLEKAINAPRKLRYRDVMAKKSNK
ncbi:MAG: hypothetical protein SPI63_01290 [Bulleidia sp.]|nr:hypothetical protein [Bulleidia sp.]